MPDFMGRGEPLSARLPDVSFLTPVGFGSWAIGGGDWAMSWGPQDDNASIAAIHKAIDLGVNWIDTAAIYGLGHSEESRRQGRSSRPT